MVVVVVMVLVLVMVIVESKKTMDHTFFDGTFCEGTKKKKRKKKKEKKRKIERKKKKKKKRKMTKSFLSSRKLRHRNNIHHQLHRIFIPYLFGGTQLRESIREREGREKGEGEGKKRGGRKKPSPCHGDSFSHLTHTTPRHNNFLFFFFLPSFFPLSCSLLSPSFFLPHQTLGIYLEWRNNCIQNILESRNPSRNGEQPYCPSIFHKRTLINDQKIIFYT